MKRKASEIERLLGLLSLVFVHAEIAERRNNGAAVILWTIHRELKSICESRLRGPTTTSRKRKGRA